MEAADSLHRLHERRGFLEKRIAEESVKKSALGDKSTLLGNYEKVLAVIEGQIFDAEMAATDISLRASAQMSAAPVSTTVAAEATTLPPSPQAVTSPNQGSSGSSQSALQIALALTQQPSLVVAPASAVVATGGGFAQAPQASMVPPAPAAPAPLSPLLADYRTAADEPSSRRRKRSRSRRDHDHDQERSYNDGEYRDHSNDKSGRRKRSRSPRDQLGRHQDNRRGSGDRDSRSNREHGRNNNKSARRGTIRVATSGIELHPCNSHTRNGATRCPWAMFPRIACPQHLRAQCQRPNCDGLHLLQEEIEEFRDGFLTQATLDAVKRAQNRAGQNVPGSTPNSAKAQPVQQQPESSSSQKSEKKKKPVEVLAPSDIKPDPKVYRRVPDGEDTKHPPKEHEIRFAAHRTQHTYIKYAIEVFTGAGGKTKSNKVILSGTGNAVFNVVNVVEILKRRVKGLHQTTEISSETVTEKYEAIEKGKDGLEISRNVSVIQIVLSTAQLDKNHHGYQAPLPESEMTEEEMEKLPRRR